LRKRIKSSGKNSSNVSTAITTGFYNPRNCALPGGDQRKGGTKKDRLPSNNSHSNLASRTSTRIERRESSNAWTETRTANSAARISGDGNPVADGHPIVTDPLSTATKTAKSPWHQKRGEDEAEDRFEALDKNGDLVLTPDELKNTRKRKK
jgi:hypothetical protein